MNTFSGKPLCSLLIVGLGIMISCTPSGTENTNTIEADSTLEERIAPPDNAATEKDQPGIERPPVPKDSLAKGEGKSVIGTSRP